MTDFSELINGIHRDGDTWTADVSEDWRQGRTLFGGLSGALCLEAAKREFIDLPPLRSAQFALRAANDDSATIIAFPGRAA